MYASTYHSATATPRPFLKDLGRAFGGALNALGDVIGSIPLVGDVARAAASVVGAVLGSPVGRAAASALCVGFGAPPQACGAAVTTAGRLSRALVTGGQSRHADGDVGAQHADECARYAAGMVCRFGGGWVYYDGAGTVSAAIEAGRAFVWFPGWPRWVHVSQIDQRGV